MSGMRVTKLPGLDFDRLSTPPEYLDLALWPRVDSTLLNDSKQIVFTKRVKAISLFFENFTLSVRQIAEATGVDRSSLIQFAANCLRLHEDGRIYGFRALIPYYHLSPYKRSKSTAQNQDGTAGDAGEFERLLSKFPELEKYLIKEAKQKSKPIKRRKGSGKIRQVDRPNDSIQSGFIALCRTLGIADTDYPLNRDYQGLRSIYTFVKKYSSPKTSVSSKASNIEISDETSIAKKVAATKLLDRIQIDGHKIDLRITIAVMDSYGMERLIEIERIWIIAVLDVVSRAVLGYTLVVSKEYSAADVIDAICNSLQPKPLRKLIIPELKYPEKGGFPSQLFPELCYATWKTLMLDNARSHLARSTVSVLVRTVGCWTAFGPKGEPIVRGVVERFFGLLTTHFAHRLPGTTGSSASDIVRKLGDPGNDLAVLMRLEEIEDLIDVLLAEYNTTVADGVGGRTPLEAVAYLLNAKRQRLVHIPPSQRGDLDLLPEGVEVVIHSTAKHGGRAYINFHDVRYFCATLDHKPQLVGTTITVRYRHKDIRRLRGFFADGSEIGIFMAAPPWSTTPHSLSLRKEIKRLVRIGKLSVRPGEEPVRCYLEYKRLQIDSSKRSATKYAAIRRQQSIPEQKNEISVGATMNASDEVSSQAQKTLVNDAEKDLNLASMNKPKVKRLSIKKTVIFR